MVIKRLVWRMAVGGWVLVFVIHYLFGAQGVLYAWRLMAENNLLQSQIEALQHEQVRLHDEIEQWEREPFLKEALAREKLQLARPDDLVYYLV